MIVLVMLSVSGSPGFKVSACLPGAPGPQYRTICCYPLHFLHAAYAAKVMYNN